MDTASLKLAGAQAVDCGCVTVQGDPKLASNCVLQAFAHRKPFRVRYDLQGIDSRVSFGMVGTPDRKVFEIQFDGNVMGGGRTTPGLERTDVHPCPTPIVLKVSAKGRVTCFPLQDPPALPSR